jgi:hypothetical protein
MKSTVAPMFIKLASRRAAVTVLSVVASAVAAGFFDGPG